MGEGPPVVFCHGTPWSSQVWWPFAESLARAFTVYLWDMPGYGQSSKDPKHTVDLATQGELLADLVRDLRLDQPHIVAHDIGGTVALRAALLHGVRFRSLLLADIVVIPPIGSPFFRFVRQHPGVLAELPPNIHAAIVSTYIQGASARGLRDADLNELTLPWITHEGREAFYRQIAQMEDRHLHELLERLGQLRTPARLVWGAQDGWIAPELGEQLAAAIPGADIRVLAGAGHLVQYDAPAALAGELWEWLSRF